MSVAHLRLVPFDAPVSGDKTNVREDAHEGPPAVSRPADRLEPWSVDSTSVAADFARAAAAASLPFELAARLVVERQLAAEAVGADSDPELVRTLDKAAAEAQIRRPISDGLASYLQTLMVGRRMEQPQRDAVALPARLRDRVGERQLASLLEARYVASALAWERASVSGGFSMTEWAAVTALRLRR